MGAAVVAGGFIIIILVALIGLMIFIGLWIYRRRYLRNSPKSKMSLLLLNTSMVITITPGVMLIWSLIWVKIDNIFIEKSRLEAKKRRYIQLESPLSFGEIIIPQDSWVNLDAFKITDRRVNGYSSRDHKSPIFNNNGYHWIFCSSNGNC